MKKQKLMQALLIALLSTLAILLTVLTVLQLLPKTGFPAVKEPITVSSAIRNVNTKTYVTDVHGVLENNTNKEIRLDSLIVEISSSDGERKTVTVVQGLVIPARTSKEIFTSFEGDINYVRITNVTAQCNGKEGSLANTAGFQPRSVAVLLAVLLAADVFFLIKACKVGYYMTLEEKLKAEKPL